MKALMKARSAIGNWVFVIGTVIGILISLLMRDKRTRDDEAPALREAAAAREKVITSEEADRRRARALAAREFLRDRKSNLSRREQLLRRARGSERGGG